MENELTAVILLTLLFRKFEMESLPTIVFGPPAAAAVVHVLRKSDQAAGKEGGPW